MIAAHHQAIRTLLDGAEHITVHDGLVPDNSPLPYVVLWMPVTDRFTTSLAGTSPNAVVRFTTTCVAENADSLAIVLDHVHARLVDARVAVTGRSLTRVDLVNSRPVFTDRDVTPHVLTAVDEWSLMSIPA